MFRLWCILIGYFLGSVSVAYIVGKVRGIDIREHGSGNAGTTNTLRVLGRRAGAIVLAGDLLKCFVAMIVCWLIFHNRYPEMKYLIRIYAAAGAILGHDYPFYLKFHGGKGVACFVGMVAFFYPGIIPAEAVIFLSIFFITHFVSLSSIFFSLGFIAQVVIFGQLGFFGLTPEQLLELYIVVGTLVLLNIFQHRTNIAKLINHEEKKTYLSKKRMPAEIPYEENEGGDGRNQDGKDRSEAAGHPGRKDGTGDSGKADGSALSETDSLQKNDSAGISAKKGSFERKHKNKKSGRKTSGRREEGGEIPAFKVDDSDFNYEDTIFDDKKNLSDKKSAVAAGNGRSDPDYKQELHPGSIPTESGLDSVMTDTEIAGTMKLPELEEEQ